MRLTAVIGGVVLAAFAAAGASHWWTVRQMLAAIEEAGGTLAYPSFTSDLPEAVPPAPVRSQPLLVNEAAPAAPQPISDTSQQEFFAALVDEIRELRGENRDLRDQMAETNRDLMQLEFRVDTHSESFRPLPVSEGRFDVSVDDAIDTDPGSRLGEGPGVLPPRDLDFPPMLE
jgi:pyruvate/2-oxoglutarate dehydrogenase complex dihydrolipoamide acyltransferase (E2) component